MFIADLHLTVQTILRSDKAPTKRTIRIRYRIPFVYRLAIYIEKLYSGSIIGFDTGFKTPVFFAPAGFDNQTFIINSLSRPVDSPVSKKIRGKPLLITVRRNIAFPVLIKLLV